MAWRCAECMPTTPPSVAALPAIVRRPFKAAFLPGKVGSEGEFDVAARMTRKYISGRLKTGHRKR